MALHPRAERFLALLAATATGGGTLEARRAAFRGLLIQSSSGPDGIAAEDVAVDGAVSTLQGRLYGPADGAAEILPALLFLHGGGLVSGDLDTHDAVCRRLAAAARCRVLAPAYRLAPEHPFPAALEDATASFRFMAAEARRLRLDSARLAIGGDSAGAGLAARVCQDLRNGGGPRPVAQVLICPVLDAAGGSESRLNFASGYFLDQATIAGDIALYAPGLDPADPRLSPGREPDLAGLPPAIVHTAEYDPVRDEGEAYAARLRSAGVPARLIRHHGSIHLFYGLGHVFPQAVQALDAIGADLAALFAEAHEPVPS